MRTLVDTPVWSELLRRRSPAVEVQQNLIGLIQQGDAVLLGPVRQELLTGIKDTTQFEKVRAALSAFPNEAILDVDYEQAAKVGNRCRAAGIQGSATDFLICALSLRIQSPIFTLDGDFELIAEVVPIQLA